MQVPAYTRCKPRKRQSKQRRQRDVPVAEMREKQRAMVERGTAPAAPPRTAPRVPTTVVVPETAEEATALVDEEEGTLPEEEGVEEAVVASSPVVQRRRAVGVEVDKSEYGAAVRVSRGGNDATAHARLRTDLRLMQDARPSRFTELYPVNPCSGAAFDEFEPTLSVNARNNRWVQLLQKCATLDLKGFGAMPKKTKRRLDKNAAAYREVKARLIPPSVRTPPSIDDVDPWEFDVNPCNGMKYSEFRSEMTQRDAYTQGTRKERYTDAGYTDWRKPSLKRTKALMARNKRMFWQEQLHACAMQVFTNRAKVSKDPSLKKWYREQTRMREPGEDDRYDADAHHVAGDEPFTLFGVGAKKRKRRKARR